MKKKILLWNGRRRKHLVIYQTHQCIHANHIVPRLICHLFILITLSLVPNLIKWLHLKYRLKGAIECGKKLTEHSTEWHNVTTHLVLNTHSAKSSKRTHERQHKENEWEKENEMKREIEREKRNISAIKKKVFETMRC